jgi:peptidoglycan/xylan/chitin deacetylase (PgdA/CDA1 family)
MKFTNPPFWVKWIYPQAKWSFPRHRGELHFTFDDGPHPETTPVILEILQQYNAKATFFCLGKNAEQYPDLLDLIRQHGHTVGNHGYEHWSALKTCNHLIIKNFIKGKEKTQAQLFRPPYGFLLPWQYLKIKKQSRIILWDIMPYDFDSNTSTKDCINTILRKAKDGSVIVLHENDKAKTKCINTLQATLKHFTQLGYKFTSLH